MLYKHSRLKRRLDHICSILGFIKILDSSYMILVENDFQQAEY